MRKKIIVIFSIYSENTLSNLCWLHCGRSGKDEYSTKLNFDTTSTPVRLIVVIFITICKQIFPMHKFMH